MLAASRLQTASDGAAIIGVVERTAPALDIVQQALLLGPQLLVALLQPLVALLQLLVALLTLVDPHAANQAKEPKDHVNQREKPVPVRCLRRNRSPSVCAGEEKESQ